MRPPPLRAVTALALAAAGLSCARVGPGVSGLVDRAPAGADELRMVYLGSGGWIMQHGSDVILSGPLFSNPGLYRTGLWRIASDTAAVDRFMSRYDVSAARAILVGHAHYDHLMDVPRVALAHAPGARIVGNRTVANTLGTWSGVGGRVDVVDDAAGEHETPGRWLSYGPSVRVMPLRSDHAPHFEGLTLYEGRRARPLTEPPRTADEWLAGETLAYLVDFLAPDGSVAFRVYYQDAVAQAPAGFAPDGLIRERPVDVAILVPATFDQVDWHPEAFVQNLRPRLVLLGHWEDFFAPADAPTRSVMLADIGHFEDRLTHVFDGSWWRPDRWTEFRFPREPGSGGAPPP